MQHYDVPHIFPISLHSAQYPVFVRGPLYMHVYRISCTQSLDFFFNCFYRQYCLNSIWFYPIQLCSVTTTNLVLTQFFSWWTCLLRSTWMLVEYLCPNAERWSKGMHRPLLVLLQCLWVLEHEIIAYFPF